MPELAPYHLTFRGGLHVGRGAESLEESELSIPSDTLFAAVVDAWRHLGGDAQEFARPFVGEVPDPPFLISSAFPFAGKVRFYPMPVDRRALFSPGTFDEHAKMLKRIRYFSEGLLRKAQEGKLLDHDLFPADENTDPTTGVALQGGSLWLLTTEADDLPEALRLKKENGRANPRPLRALRHLNVWDQRLAPRVSVDRISSASNVFHAARVTFAEGCGLWFAVHWRKPEQTFSPGVTFRQAFTSALSALQENGLGGERSTGYGAFHFRDGSPLSLPEAEPGAPALLLSRYHPRQDELPEVLTHPKAAYSLVAVGGWLRTPDGPAQRRKRLWMVAEGSTVCPRSFPPGDVVDVRPTYQSLASDVPHPVYRLGLALATAWPAAPEVPKTNAHGAS